jgi:hypothetical protein
MSDTRTLRAMFGSAGFRDEPNSPFVTIWEILVPVPGFLFQRGYEEPGLIIHHERIPLSLHQILIQ